MHLRLLVVLILAVTLSGGAGFVLGQSSDTAGANGAGAGAVTLRSVDQRLSRVARDARLARQYSYRACLNAFEFGERLCRAPR